MVRGPADVTTNKDTTPVSKTPTSLYEIFGTDKQAETGEGIILVYGASHFFARRAGGSNINYQEELRKVVRPMKKQMDLDVLPTHIYVTLIQKVFARTVITGWHNVTDRDGNDMPYNEANFMALMKDLPDLWEAIQQECMAAQNFRSSVIQEDGKLLGE